MKSILSPVLKIAVLCSATMLVSGCGPQQREVAAAESHVLQVLKSPTCGCCQLWIEHAEEQGFVAQISHPEELSREKLALGIQPAHQSCHTAISEQGFVFEGHVPAGLIHQFIANPPVDAIGLAVPGMPLGSPGMELGERFQPYDVLLLRKDGSSEIYASIDSPEEQY